MEQKNHNIIFNHFISADNLGYLATLLPDKSKSEIMELAKTFKSRAETDYLVSRKIRASFWDEIRRLNTEFVAHVDQIVHTGPSPETFQEWTLRTCNNTDIYNSKSPYEFYNPMPEYKQKREGIPFWQKGPDHSLYAEADFGLGTREIGTSIRGWAIKDRLTKKRKY